MERSTAPGDPSFGVVNAESIVEGIQNCHMALEESRVRLLPLMKLLDADNDGRPGATTTSTRKQNGQGHLDYTDLHAVEDFFDCIDRTYESVDALMVRLADSGLVPIDNNVSNQTNRGGESKDNVYLLMASNCINKATKFISRHCLTLLEEDSFECSGPLDDRQSTSIDNGEGVRIQSHLARLSELALRVFQINASLIPCDNRHIDEEESETITSQTIIEAYSQYQRRCLRTRSKPAISSVAELRRVAKSQNCYVSDILEAERQRQQHDVALENDGEDSEIDEVAAVSRGRPHSQAVTCILGEASSLIQPLAAWRDALQLQSSNNDTVVSLLHHLCKESIELLDTEAQTLAATVGSWFSSDQRGVATLDNDNNNSGNDATKSDLLSIESSLEEMAWLCQLISRYCLYSEQIFVRKEEQGDVNGNGYTNTKLQDLLTEQSLHYSTLETKLATLQFSQAVSLACTQLIELGRPSLQVPSIVEDAHFISVRAIERAAGTRSERAVWTVGHWVCEVWGVDHSSHGVMESENGILGVYLALIHGVGCAGGSNYSDETLRDDAAVLPSPKVENAFAAALLDAVDDEDCDGEGKNNSRPGIAPTSGGLSSFFNRGGNGRNVQSMIDAELCALNGISAASNACCALSGLFADLVEESIDKGEARNGEKASSMLTFARDELNAHSRSYLSLLRQRVRALVNDLCGGDDIFDFDGSLCLQNLRLFVENEEFNLDSLSFRQLEDEDRLESLIIGPLRRSQIFEEIGRDKCDAVVVLQIAEAMGSKAADIILQVLLLGNKQFNEYGALLLSKQLRMLQNLLCSLVLDLAKTGSTVSILNQFARANQAVSILQLEKPSDWLQFSYKVGESLQTNLSADEIQKIMCLRVDFSEEAIARVCIQIG